MKKFTKDTHIDSESNLKVEKDPQESEYELKTDKDLQESQFDQSELKSKQLSVSNLLGSTVEEKKPKLLHKETKKTVQFQEDIKRETLSQKEGRARRLSVLSLHRVNSLRSARKIISLQTKYKSGDMSRVAKFILYSAANDYISHDYEHCAKTCNIKYDDKEKETLFKANLHRFNALAQEQIYLQQISKDD